MKTTEAGVLEDGMHQNVSFYQYIPDFFILDVIPVAIEVKDHQKMHVHVFSKQSHKAEKKGFHNCAVEVVQGTDLCR